MAIENIVNDAAFQVRVEVKVSNLSEQNFTIKDWKLETGERLIVAPTETLGNWVIATSW